VQGTHEGIEAARARGQRIGRPPAMTPEQIRHARDLLTRPDNTVNSIAKLLGVSRTTLYKYVPELATRWDTEGPSSRPRGWPSGCRASGVSDVTSEQGWLLRFYDLVVELANYAADCIHMRAAKQRIPVRETLDDLDKMLKDFVSG